MRVAHPVCPLAVRLPLRTRGCSRRRASPRPAMATTATATAATALATSYGREPTASARSWRPRRVRCSSGTNSRCSVPSPISSGCTSSQRAIPRRRCGTRSCSSSLGSSRGHSARWFSANRRTLDIVARRLPHPTGPQPGWPGGQRNHLCSRKRRTAAPGKDGISVSRHGRAWQPCRQLSKRRPPPELVTGSLARVGLEGAFLRRCLFADYRRTATYESARDRTRCQWGEGRCWGGPYFTRASSRADACAC
mmetsp:Transcript_24083/g.60907  ORF Transcript_24083/g.60907 Transcript_24083/m.60907 type:complete len:251 (+) Transcript_24083:3-755(+)